MTRISVVTCLAASALLSGCIPQSGHNRKHEACAAWTGIDPASLMYRYASGYEDCIPDYYQAKEPAADSLKHTLYTEKQRLEMAESAARILYPMADHRFEISVSIAEFEVDSLYPDGHAAYLNCNEMATAHDFALYLQDTLPEDTFYNAEAHEWSRLYSDEQLSKISAAARNAGKVTKDLNNDLSPQPTLGQYLNIPYKTVESYIKANKTKFEPVIRRIHDKIASEKRFASTRCSKQETDTAGHYELRDIPLASHPL